MTKRVRRKKRAQKRETNYWLIGGMILGGIVLVALIALSFRGPNQLDLVTYCENNPENCIVEGAAAASVTVVEVSDYGCGHCRNFNETTAVAIHDQYVETGQVKWVVMPFALTDQNGTPRTLDTAVAAMCAAEQDKFTEFHQAAFALQDDTVLFNTEEGFMQVAQQVELDEAAFTSCLADNEYEDIVRRNITAASSAAVDSTPSFMLGGELLRGNQPLSVFQKRIESLFDS
jgi:protein-disulfide isomerase